MLICFAIPLTHSYAYFVMETRVLSDFRCTKMPTQLNHKANNFPGDIIMAQWKFYWWYLFVSVRITRTNNDHSDKRVRCSISDGYYCETFKMCKPGKFFFLSQRPLCLFRMWRLIISFRGLFVMGPYRSWYNRNVRNFALSLHFL